jgi:DNA-binding MarR family transcriptional regulator
MERTTSTIRDADVSKVYTELSRITRRAAIRARGPESSLSVVDHSLVDFILQHPGCMAIDIARYLRLNRSTISRQLSGLLAAGLVETVDGGVGNAKPLGVTDAGRDAFERSLRMHRDGLEARLADWSDDDVALLAGLLERLGVADEPGFSEPYPPAGLDPLSSLSSLPSRGSPASSSSSLASPGVEYDDEPLSGYGA